MQQRRAEQTRLELIGLCAALCRLGGGKPNARA
jgi:hypothetical protein